MNTSQLKITINAEGDSARDVLMLFGGALESGRSDATVVVQNTDAPAWVTELREAIRRVEETVEKYNACRLANQRQVIAQYEGLAGVVRELQERPTVVVTAVRELQETQTVATMVDAVQETQTVAAAEEETEEIVEEEEEEQLADAADAATEEQLADAAAEEEDVVEDEEVEEEVEEVVEVEEQLADAAAE